MTREFQFLLRMCAPQAIPTSSGQKEPFTTTSPDWNSLAKMAQQHRLTSLLYMGLLNAGIVEIDPVFLSGLERVSRQIFRRNLTLTAEWFNIWKLLQDQGISGICYKGPALAAAAFGYMGARFFEDLDIFVQTPKDARRAKDILLAQGYQLNDQLRAYKEEYFQLTQCEYQLYKPGQELFVDLHWQVMPDFFSFPFPVEEAWTRLVPVSIGSREFLSFCPEDTLLILCAHGTKHWWAQLSHVTDIAWLVTKNFAANDALWVNVFKRAQAMKSVRMLCTGLALAHELFALALPGWVQKKITNDRSTQILCRHAIRRLCCDEQDQLPFWEYLQLLIRSRECWSTRWRFCLHGIFVPSLSDYTWTDLPDSLFPLYYVLRPLRIILSLFHRG